MKALTILEPWASLIQQGKKRIETRTWSTQHRGPLAIHSGRSHWNVKKLLDDYSRGVSISPFDPAMLNSMLTIEGAPMTPPIGCVLAVADLVDCVEMTPAWIKTIHEPELSFGGYEPGRFAWMLDNIRPIKPVLAKGHQGLWVWRGKPEWEDS